MTLAILATAANAACGVHVAGQRPAAPKPIERYTFPLSMPSNTLICVESIPIGYDPCMTLRRLRELARDTEAD